MTNLAGNLTMTAEKHPYRPAVRLDDSVLSYKAIPDGWFLAGDMAKQDEDGYDVDGEELQTFAKERLAAYKYPRAVCIVDDLPKGATGKILRREVEAPEEARS